MRIPRRRDGTFSGRFGENRAVVAAMRMNDECGRLGDDFGRRWYTGPRFGAATRRGSGGALRTRSGCPAGARSIILACTGVDYGQWLVFACRNEEGMETYLLDPSLTLQTATALRPTLPAALRADR